MEKSDPIGPEFVKRIGKISHQSAVFLGGSLFVIVAGWFLKVYVARTIGASALGVFGLGMTVVAFFGVFSSFGLPLTAARYIPFYSARGEGEQVRRLLLRSFAFLLPVNLVLAGAIIHFRDWIAITLYREPRLAPYLPVFACIFVLAQLSTFFSEALRGYQQVARLSVVTTFLRFGVRLAVIVPLFLAGQKLGGYVSGELSAQVVTTCVLAYFIWRFTPAPGSTSGGGEKVKTFNREVLAFSASMIGLQMLGFLSSQSDKVLVGIYLTAKDVGVYTTVIAIAEYLPTCLIAVNSILGPVIAELHARQATVLLDRIFKTVTKWILGFTWPVAVVMVIYGRPLLRIFGREFESGYMALVFLVIGGIVNVGTGSVGYMLIMSGHQKWEVGANFVNAIVMVPLYLTLIPRLGIAGAALAAGAATASVNLLRLWLVKHHLGLFPYDREFVKIIPALLVTVLALISLRQWTSSLGDVQILMLAMVVGYSAFLLVAALFGMSTDDRAILNAALNSAKQYVSSKRSGPRIVVPIQPDREP